MPTNEHIPVRIKSNLLGLFPYHANNLWVPDIKPNNILANDGAGNDRFGTIQLGDLGDSVPEEIATNNGGHIISAPIYRAPGAMLNARWTVAVDIWSLGATVSCFGLHHNSMRRICSFWSQAICYLLRRHIFVPNGLDPGDECFALAVLILQNKYFGPFPEKFFNFLTMKARQSLDTY